MWSQSQVQMLTGELEQASTQRPVTRQPRVAPREPRMPRSPRAPNVEVDVDPNTFMNRRNSTPGALGKLKRTVFLGHIFYVCPDAWVWCIQGFITFFIVFANMAITWAELSWCHFILVSVMVSIGAFCSILVTCTDPGVYPRLNTGEEDPLGNVKELVFCRVCQMRRPPRVSHCYICNVCVLEHDHHCGVIGGCVGRRSLRWFTTFTVMMPIACSIGMFWQFRYVVNGIIAVEKSNSANRRSVTTQVPVTTFMPGRRTRMQDDTADVVGLGHVASIFMILIDLCVIVLVGSLGVMYCYLTLSSTTRRESQKQETSFKVCCQPKRMWQNLMHTAFPPPSLLEGEAEPVEMTEVTETDALV